MVPLLLVLMIRCFKPTVNKNALLLEWSKPMRKGIQPISKRIELELMRMERVSHRIALMSPSLQPLTTGLRHRVTSLKALTIGLIQVRARLIPALGRLMPVILQIDASDIDSLRYYWWYRPLHTEWKEWGVDLTLVQIGSNGKKTREIWVPLTQYWLSRGKAREILSVISKDLVSKERSSFNKRIVGSCQSSGLLEVGA